MIGYHFCQVHLVFDDLLQGGYDEMAVDRASQKGEDGCLLLAARSLLSVAEVGKVNSLVSLGGFYQGWDVDALKKCFHLGVRYALVRA